MISYKLNTNDGSISKLQEYSFKNEGIDRVSPQAILANNPEILLELPELELFNPDACFSCREYKTNRGPIDILILTKNGEIIIVETKLIKNPESTRGVVAQVIDYAKALSNDSYHDFINKLSSKTKDNGFIEEIKNNVNVSSIINSNLKTGNFKVIIVGDVIHPNVVEMVESIHSAPHLSFTIYMVELNTSVYDQQYLVLSPKVVSNTFEMERSVIKIEINAPGNEISIESEIPSVTSKGTKPILTWEQYIDNVGNGEMKKIINDFRNKWIEEVEDSINMGQVGFSAGVSFSAKRIPIQFVYDNRIAIVSERMAQRYQIPNELYNDYKNEIKKSAFLYDQYLIGNKVEIPFEVLSKDSVELITNAAINLAKKIKAIE